MELRRITQTELHEKTGIGKSSISTYLKGEYKAKQDKVDIIAEVLHVDPTWLMGYDVPMNKPYQQVPPSRVSSCVKKKMKRLRCSRTHYVPLPNYTT